MQTTYGQGRSGKWGTQAESWGDKIADRSGGEDTYDTSKPYFVSEDGKFTQYTITSKNSKNTYQLFNSLSLNLSAYSLTMVTRFLRYFITPTQII